ncbi:hypothetical protein JCM17846_20060 [Iodidimonas nitroreducens]|uniref:HTH marR-type domain-containing protein n=1 Tax=Iodidimonas nitroreducens TaxID=1236968 RepID=A0A5A7N983_9PROT|nr:MarR family transcriptional regulator [Iodidimonas nitroreducens]GAK33208.1 HTH-type transcriptional regulator PetP [alpha proteobacterium Q-1]GER04324.1 hypothetical protein JCM17846_20060 [Iodidimonas nitroreducens]
MSQTPPVPRSSHIPSLFLREDELKRGAELIMRSYAALGDAIDGVLAAKGLGRAHYRALLMIARNRELSLTDLQHLLRVRKQSLARIIRDLNAQNLITTRPAGRDRRLRLVALTESGLALESALFNAIRERMANAYRRAGPVAVGGFWDVLTALAGEDPISHE